ncbi:MAG: tape measure protein [Selenomonadales bacterium]|nr:tape measure protein [Selenomonadales bacterium]
MDGMSPSLKAINNAMNVVMSSFEELQRTSGKGIDTASFVAARQEMFRANQAIDAVEKNLREAAAAQDKLNGEMRESGGLAGGLASKVGGLVAAYTTLEGAMSLARAADDYTNIKSRLDLINDGLQTTEQLQEMVRASANSTRSDYKATADMVGKLGIQAGQAFSSNEEILRFAEQINKHIAIAGTSTAAAEGAMMQMTQAMSNGVLRGEELNSVLDGMPTVAKTIEAHFRKMGDTRGIKAIAEEGLITADIVKEALFSAAEETDSRFNAMGVTFGSVWNLFKNTADQALTPVYKRLGELSNSKGFQTFAVTAGKAVAVLGSAIVTVFDMMAGLGGFVAENWAVVSPILAAVGGAIGTMLVAGIVTATKSLYAMAVAAWAANAPLLPWIAAGAAVAAVAYLIWQNSDKLVAIWESMKAAAAAVTGAVVSMVRNAGAAGMRLADMAAEWGKGAYEAVKSWIGKIPSMIGDFLGSIKEGFTLKLSGSGGNVAQNAKGGIYGKGAFLTTFAEKSPEAAIPLDGSSRAIGLWQQAGQMLGVKPSSGTNAVGKVEIHLTVNNTNHISRDTDADAVIQKITDKLYEALETGMEGAVS